MAKRFELRFDARTDEIETAYRAFQNKYTLKKRVLYTAVYLIVLVLGIDLIVKNPTGMAGYIAAGLAAGILLFNWIKPVMIRKKLVKTLAELDDETYIASFYDDKIVIETMIRKKSENESENADEPTETVAITASGVYPVEEGSLAAEEAKKAEAAEKTDEPIPKTVYPLSETEVAFAEKDGLFLLFVNRSYIHTIPLRCLSEEQAAQTRAYFEEKLSLS